VTAALLSIGLLGSSALAQTVTYPRPAGGKIVEVPASGWWRYTVSLTDKTGGPFITPDLPKSAVPTPPNPAEVKVPPVAQLGTDPPPNAPQEEVTDVTQTSEKIASRTPGGRDSIGELNVLYIEAQRFDQDSKQYVLDSTFGTLGERMGFNDF